MKQNKLLILSLLASFLLLTLTSYATAANTVTFGTIDVCPQPAGSKVLVSVQVGNDVDLSALDIIGQVVSSTGGVDLVVTDVTFGNRMMLPEVLDQRYPIGDLGSGLFRLGAVKINETGLQVGDGQIATLELEFLSDCALGTAVIDPATYDCNGNTFATSFVDGDANAIAPTVNSGAVNVVNADPFFTNCPSTGYEIYWKIGPWGNNSVSFRLEAEDNDLACGCDALTFGLVSGVGTINSGTGVYSFTAGPTTIGCHTIVVKVEDEYGGSDTCSFDITVLNNPPEFTVCPDETINILWGETATATVEAVDPDLGPSALLFTLESYNGPASAMPDVDPGTGAVTWNTAETNDFIGDFEICVKVTDQAPSTVECPIDNSAVCCFTVRVEPKFRVTIEKGEGPAPYNGAYLGDFTSLSIDLDGSYESMEMGGFDFLITYDNSILSLVDAEAGDLLNSCGWEYFTYRNGYDGNCGTGCPSGAVRLIALAEETNGAYHPSCYSSTTETQLAVLNFFVVNNHMYSCQYAPVQFFWMDCGDNTISSKFGDSLFMAAGVVSFEGMAIDPAISFPSVGGIIPECLLGTEKGYPIEAIDFKNGGVDIICDSAIDDRGDINMDGLSNTIADAVMFTNYFIIGSGAFGDHVPGSAAASDVNNDGTPLTVADLVYLIRVIQGDAMPYPKPAPGATFGVSTQQIAGNVNVNVNTTDAAGAALFVFNVNGEVGDIQLSNGVNMQVLSGLENNELRVLVYNIESSASINSGSLMSIPVSGSLELKDVEAADYNGAVMNTTMRVLPSTFELAQNYPNPFNPTTTIALDLPVGANYDLEVYNIAGQKVRTFSGYSEAGTLEIVWDGKDASGSTVASGVYFYKVKAGDFTATKRMVMLK